MSNWEFKNPTHYSYHFPVSLHAVGGRDDVVGVDERPSAAGHGRLARVHDGRHPRPLVHARVDARDDPPAPRVGLPAH